MENNNKTGIILPNDFKNHISAEFGEAGRVWLNDFPQLLENCIDQWALKDLKLSTYLSFNAILIGRSEVYGDVALKMGVPHPEFYSECNYILYHQNAEYDNRNSVVRRCLANDYENHSMLLEWISPGDELWSVTDLAERFHIGVDIITASPVKYNAQYFSKLSSPTSSFPSFREWMDLAYDKARKAGRGSALLRDCWNDSYNLLFEVTKESDELMLLHGDLHHSNILLDREQGWRIIDPKGVLGVKYMECGRFIRNQMWEVDKHLQSGKLEQKDGFSIKKRQLNILLESFAKAFDTTADVILKCCCIDAALSSCWYLEAEFSSSVLNERTIHAENECRFFWDQMQAV